MTLTVLVAFLPVGRALAWSAVAAATIVTGTITTLDGKVRLPGVVVLLTGSGCESIG